MMHRCAGFTLIEMAFVALIGALILAVVVLVGSSTNDAYITVRQGMETNFSMRQALNRISDDMRQSNSSVIVITPGTDYDSIDFQLPVSQTANVINWGAYGVVGWHIQVFVQDGQLIRRVTDAAGAPMRVDEVLARNVDFLLDGQKGFSVAPADATVYQISLRITTQRGQTVWRRTETTSVSVRN